MIRTWEKEKLSEICSIKTGKLNSNQSVENGEYPFFTCAPETFRINKFAFDTEAVLLAGNNAAGIYPLKYYKGKFNAYQRTYVLETLDEKKLDVRFLYYALIPTLGYFQSISIGASTQYLTKAVLDNFLLPLPKVETQTRIAEILSAYDDLIENNLKRIRLLEESARLLYREWFVRLKFPNHEHTPRIDGLPEGWAKVSVSDLGEVITGKTPSTTDTNNYGDDFPFVKTPDMHGNIFVVKTESSLSEQGANTQRNKYLSKGTIMVSCIGTVGVVSLASTVCQTNQQINSVIPKSKEYQFYSFFALQDLKPTMEAIGGGATMNNVNKSKFESLDVLLPSESLLQNFDEVANPMFEQILNLLTQNQKLKQARDLLLPRLMSGEIAV